MSDLLTAPIPQLVRRIAVPASVGMFFNTMYNFVDTYCAKLISTDAQAALAMSFPIFFLVLAAGSGLNQGTTALMANALGAQDEARARQVLAQSVLLACVLGVVLSVLGFFAAPAMFRYLGAEGDYLATSLAYMNVIMAGGIFFILQMTLNAALSAQGNTTLYRNLLIAGFFANCALNPALMFGWLGLPPLGVAGIALATVLIQILTGAVLAWALAKGRLGSGMTRRDFMPHGDVLRSIAVQAFPASLNMLTVALGIFIITKFTSEFSKEAVAAYGIATRVEQLILLPTMGLSTAVITLVGQNNGAGLHDRVRSAWLHCVSYGAGLMLIGGAFLFFTREWFMRQFTADAQVVALGSDYLLTACLTEAAYPTLFTTVFMLQGLKRPAFALWMGLYRQIVGQVGIIYLLAFILGWGLWGVWWGISLVTWSGALFAVWWGHRLLNGMNKTAQ